MVLTIKKRHGDIHIYIWNGRRTKIQLLLWNIKEVTWSQPPLVSNRNCGQSHFSVVKGQYSSVLQLEKIWISKLEDQSDRSCRWKRRTSISITNSQKFWEKCFSSDKWGEILWIYTLVLLSNLNYKDTLKLSNSYSFILFAYLFWKSQR